MSEIKMLKGKKGPYFMTSVEGVAYASQDEGDVRAFLDGREVEKTQTGDTWFWVKRKSGENGSREKVEEEPTEVVSERIRRLVRELHGLVCPD